MKDMEERAMRFSADIRITHSENDKIIEKFLVEHFTDQEGDENYIQFLNFLSNHETLLEEEVSMTYEGKIVVNGITKNVSKEFLNELYDALE